MPPDSSPSLHVTPQWYRRYGLTVRSEVPLGPATPAPDGAEADVCISVGETLDAFGEDPDGETLAELWNEHGRLLYRLVRHEAGHLLRVYRIADFVLDEAAASVEVRPLRDAPAGLPEVLVQGSVLAFVLALRGKSVLHASAVAFGDQVFALAGPTGTGKSTVAALACAGGATLVADDLLCLEGGGRAVGTGLGAELRLRDVAQPLVELFATRPPSELTADRRLAIHPPATGDAPFALHGIVFPQLDHGGGPAVAERVRGADYVVELARSARITGWRDREQQRRFYDATLELADAVPAWRLRVPFRPPFAPLPGEELAELLGEAARA